MSIRVSLANGHRLLLSWPFLTPPCPVLCCVLSLRCVSAENILLKTPNKSSVKLIDFGSSWQVNTAHMRGAQLQSRRIRRQPTDSSSRPAYSAAAAAASTCCVSLASASKMSESTPTSSRGSIDRPKCCLDSTTRAPSTCGQCTLHSLLLQTLTITPDALPVPAQLLTSCPCPSAVRLHPSRVAGLLAAYCVSCTRATRCSPARTSTSSCCV